jgi:hypothetical protein
MIQRGWDWAEAVVMLRIKARTPKRFLILAVCESEYKEFERI